jgi:phosphoribosylamine--glycine ligase
MQILLIGAGGREHALAWKISQSSQCGQLFIAPGNAGTSQMGKNVPIKSNDFVALGNFCIQENIDMVVVGPEEPLVLGIYDFFKADDRLKDIIVVGPSKEGAKLEGSKAYAKAFMQRYGIPTASYREFDVHNFAEGIDFIQSSAVPIVLKADGLAAGKGVIITSNREEALFEFEQMIQQSKFGVAGQKVVIESFLKGIELSVFALTDGKAFVLLPEAKDYKRVGIGDTGLNTGGMGAVSPVPFADKVFMEKVNTRIVAPTVNGLAKEGIVYQGFIFFGLISVEGEPYVIEYNCRLGDPETEVILPRLENDLVELFCMMADESLNHCTIETSVKAGATVMAVSGGYPGKYEKGKIIEGIIQKVGIGNVMVFQAGTMQHNNNIVTDGGRVLAVTALADNLKQAVDLSIQTLENISFEGMNFRSDIGFEFI